MSPLTRSQAAYFAAKASVRMRAYRYERVDISVRIQACGRCERADVSLRWMQACCGCGRADV
eukprot:2493753-Pleurochrysis_carterae.AAC.1